MGEEGTPRTAREAWKCARGSSSYDFLSDAGLRRARRTWLGNSADPDIQAQEIVINKTLLKAMVSRLGKLHEQNELDSVELDCAIRNLNRLKRAVQNGQKREANRAINEICKLLLRNLD